MSGWQMPSSGASNSALDSLMMANADLSGPSKGNPFKGPALKDVKVQKSQAPVFKSSEKARDWSCLAQNLEDAFSVAQTPAAPARQLSTSEAPTTFQPSPHLLMQQQQQQPIPDAAPSGDFDDWGDFQTPAEQPIAASGLPGAAAVNAPATQMIFPQHNMNLNTVASQNPQSLQPAAAVIHPPAPVAAAAPTISCSEPQSLEDDFSDFISATPAVPVIAPTIPVISSAAPTLATPITAQPNNIPVDPLPSREPSQPTLASVPAPPLVDQVTNGGFNATVGSRLAAFQESSPVLKSKSSPWPRAQDPIHAFVAGVDFGDLARPEISSLQMQQQQQQQQQQSEEPSQNAFFDSQPALSSIAASALAAEKSALSTVARLPEPLPAASAGNSDKYEAFRCFSDDLSGNIGGVAPPLPPSPPSAQNEAEEDEFGDFIDPVAAVPPPSAGEQPAAIDLNSLKLPPATATTVTPQQPKNADDLGIISLDPLMPHSLSGAAAATQLANKSTTNWQQSLMGGDPADLGLGGSSQTTIAPPVSDDSFSLSSLDAHNSSFKFSESGATDQSLGSFDRSSYKFDSSLENRLHSDQRERYTLCFDDAAPPSPWREWRGALQQILVLVAGAADAFGSATTADVLREVLAAPEAAEYVRNVREVYRVFLRLRTTHQNWVADEKERHGLDAACVSIERAWESFLANAETGGGDLADCCTFDNARLARNSPDRCGVCLQTVFDQPVSMMNNSKLTYGGCQYHAACANFWINCVDLTLPALTKQACCVPK